MYLPNTLKQVNTLYLQPSWLGLYNTSTASLQKGKTSPPMSVLI